MPQRRKQQKGAGLLDILSSDPAKKIEANNKRIGELEKESEQKCAEIKKMNDQKIVDLKKKNEELQKETDAKKAAEASSGSGFSFSKITDIFKPAEKPAATDKPADAKPAEVKDESNAEVRPADAKPAEVKDESNAEVRPAEAAKPVPAAGDRMFGGKKSKRRRGSKARKSAKK